MKILLKILGALLVLVVVVAVAGYAWLTRDRSPAHPALAAAQMAPLIPLRDFWANRNSEWGYSLSPGGSYMSWWAVEGADTVLKIQDRRAGDIRVVRPTNGQSARYEWVHDDRSLLLRHYKDDRWSVWRINAANVDAEWVKVTPRGFKNWRDLYRPKAPGERRLITTRDHSGEFQDV